MTNSLEIQDVDYTKLHFSIRYGREAKMYTLWRVQPIAIFKPESFVKNLSTEYEKAIFAAKEYAGDVPFEINAPESLNDIVRGEDVLRFGKYKDQRISEINNEKYLIWIWKCCPVPSQRSKDETDLLIRKSDPLWNTTQNYLLETGVLVDYNDRIVTKSHAEKIEAIKLANSNSLYVGSIGDKIRLNVTLERTNSYDSAYGTTMIYSFKDENGNIVVYKGKFLLAVNVFTDSITGKTYSSADSKFWKNLISIGVDKGNYHTFNGNYETNQAVRDTIRSTDFQGQDANYFDSKTNQFFNLECENRENFLQKGDVVTITGTVKDHSEYKGTKQTILQRVKTV